jgi:hypothetical protein
LDMLRRSSNRETFSQPSQAGNANRAGTLSRIGLVLLIVAGMAACGEPVPDPDPSDASPAVVTMTAFVPTTDPSKNEEIGFRADCCDATRQVPRGKTIDFIASAKDVESGIKIVAIRGRIDWICRQGDIGQKKTATILAQNPKPPSTINPPLDQLLAQFSVRYDEYSKCTSGFSLVSVSGTIHAEGANTRDQGQTTKALTFEYT